MKVDNYYNENSPDENKAGEMHKEPQHESAPGSEHHGSGNIELKRVVFANINLDSLIDNRYAIISLALLIILVNVTLRVGMLQYQGLFEPDGFFYYTVIRQAITNHYSITNPKLSINALSGFPSHNFIGEAPGLIYLTVLGYYLLHGLTGLGALTIMRWMPILFGVLYAILAFFIARKLSKSNVLGLLAMFFVSVSSGNIARTAGTVYRGDSFITLFILLALFFMLKCFEEKPRIKKYIYGMLASISLSLGIVIWLGAPFITVVYMLALIFSIAYGFIFGSEEILFSTLVLSVGLVLMNILQSIYIVTGLSRTGVELTGPSFYVLLAPLLLGSILTYLLLKNKHKLAIATTARGRAILLGVAALVALIVIYAAFGSLLQQIASPLAPTTSSGAIAASNATKEAIVQTTQELQPPSWSFLWSSFNVQIILAPLGVILFALLAYLMYKGNRFVEKEHFVLSNISFLVILSYFLVTGYLQSSAIRFNAIISMPIAIFAAFAAFVIGKLLYDVAAKNRAKTIAIAIAVAIIVALMLLDFYAGLSSQFVVVAISIALMCVMLIAVLIYSIYGTVKSHIQMKYIVLGFIIVIMLYTFYNTYFESYTAVQADGVNPSFLSAMTWLKNNTPTNATVLALWPDGSVVEGWGNRTSYMDSVGGENGTRIYAFAQYLFNTSTDDQYLYSIHKPQYLVVRNFWYEELGGIAQEGLVANSTEYGYVVLPIINSTRNATAQFFVFETNQYPYYKAEMTIIPNQNGTNTTFKAYLGLANSSRLAPMRSIILFNTSNAAYSIMNQTNSSVNYINYTLMVSFAGHTINGAYILGPKLVKSNVFRFTFLCNSYQCPYDGKNVTLTSVYMNGDTRIYRINYLNGS